MVQDIAISYWEEGGNPIKQEIIGRLEDNYDIEILDPEKEHPDLGEEDFYHMAKRREESLADLRRAYGEGVTTINPPQGVHRAVNRLQTLHSLEREGIPVPRHDYGAASEVNIDTPAVSKPMTEIGDSRHDIQFYGYISHPDIETSSSDLDFVEERLVEDYIDTPKHFKSYLLGEEVRAVELSGPDVKIGIEVVPDREMERIVHDVGKTMELSLMEVDLVEDGGEYMVVDVNSTPSLAGVKDAVDVYEDIINENLDI